MKLVTIIISFIAILFLAQAITVSGQASERSVYGRYMTPQELYAIYGDKSWKWEQGVGHFARGNRRFTAVLSVEDRSYGTGKWTLPGLGKLCFRARWRTKEGIGTSWTCFAHRTKDGEIYQRKLPGGKWYRFRNRTVAEGDEFSKIVEGNLVSSDLKKIGGG